ncbi:MAG: HPF/RaiA family ribosome-associated protein [Myxococcota bacterium]
MQVPVDIRFRHVESSDALKAAIEEHVKGLEKYSQRITSCHVTVDHVGGHAHARGRTHHRQGAGAHYRVSIRLTVPGAELFVGRDPEEHVNFEDAYAAVNEAFDAMKRQLQDAERTVRQDVKHHVRPLHGRVTKLLDGFGFLTTELGRELYFHQNAVVGGFSKLAVGDEVRFTEHPGEGEKGPQASTVTRVGKSGHAAIPTLG